VPAKNFNYGLKPKIGNVVTFTYENFSRRSIPVSPKIDRIRTDVSWEQVIYNERRAPVQLASTPFFPSSLPLPHTHALVGQVEKAGFAPMPMGYWNAKQGKNMRAFFENFAKRNRFDPLLAENWYKFTAQEILKVQVRRFFYELLFNI